MFCRLTEEPDLDRLLTRPFLVAIRTMVAAIGLLVLAAAPPSAPAASPDYAIEGGWFFTQGGGDTARVDDGFSVLDDEDANFWAAFQENGGVAAVGYPVSARFRWDGFVTQVMQKAVFQWRPESSSVAFVNVFDDLSRHGFDAKLAEQLVPEPDSFTDEEGLDFGQIIAKRTALLDAEPAFRRTYDAVSDPLKTYGLPQSRVREYDGLRAIRLQRAVLQIWTRDFPWADAGTVTIANGGDLAKKLGLFNRAASAFVPIPPPAAETPATGETGQGSDAESGQGSGSVPADQMEQSTEQQYTALEVLYSLDVAAERTAGYKRTDWPHWGDYDGDGCNTRCEVLAAERRTDGTWYSVYDGQSTSNSSTFDIDHFVPLAEAHESGGWAWDADTKWAYANDLSYEHSLIAVSASSNRSKGKRDPAEWLPPAQNAHCFYAEVWVLVKWGWKLTVDRAEQDALARVLSGCPQTYVDDIMVPQPGAPDSTDQTSGNESNSNPQSQVRIDSCDARGELVRLSGPAGFNLSGWRISDQGPRFTHTFASGARLGNDGTFDIASGNASGDIKPWGSRHVWNNDGDVATLTDPNGRVAATRNCS